MTYVRRTLDERRELIRQALELSDAGLSQLKIAQRLDVAQPTVHNWLRRYKPTLQQKIGAVIRAELVCCDIYQRMENVKDDPVAWKELRHGADYHAPCFYGEWSARIAEKVAK